jgi:hypothetical protein
LLKPVLVSDVVFLCRLGVRSTDHSLHALQQSLRQYRRFRFAGSGSGRPWYAPLKRRTALIVSHAVQPPGARTY